MQALEKSFSSPRTEAVIAEVMAKHPGGTPAALARYFEAVHQELAPLCRQLEAENRELRKQIWHMARAEVANLAKAENTSRVSATTTTTRRTP